jgi:regulatory protein
MSIDDSLPCQGEHERAIELAYKSFSRRDRTVAELRTFLERKRVGPSAIDHAVEELRASGFLDDARYARRFAGDKRALERWGSERIGRVLRQRGVDPELIDDALASWEPSDELASALALLAERLPLAPADDRERDRAWQLLVRRGYRPELAYEAVRAHEQRGGNGRQAA